LKRWDRRAAQSADLYIANSTSTRDRIREAYDVDAEIVFPPCGIDPLGPQEPVSGLEPGFYLCVSRLLTYKHVDAILEAFGSVPSTPRCRWDGTTGEIPPRTR